MEEVPLPPLPPPPTKLWTCLLLPLAVTLVSSIVVMILLGAGVADSYDALVYLLVPGAAGALAGLLGTPGFVLLMRQRYRGRSLWLLGFAYPIGQIVLSGVTGFGACLAIAASVGIY
ncbi:MAG: hypothetical protein ABGZ49_15265 [Akkermansiaceae bacterium]